jgi:hypothetical protein
MRRNLLSLGILMVSSTARLLGSSCMVSQYAGFDSRLKVEIAGRIAPSQNKVVGFEIALRTLIAATSDQLSIITAGKLSSFALVRAPLSILTDEGARVSLVDSKGVHSIPDSANSTPLNARGQVFNSGNSTLLDVYSEAGSTRLVLRHYDGSAFGIAKVRGQLRTASWNREGLSAVIGNSLYTWVPGNQQFVRLLTDSALKDARDVCLLSQKRAVLALPNAVLLITDRSQLIIVAFEGRCRWSNDTLYLLDQRTGLIWAVRGVEQLGDPERDEQHARTLIQQLPSGGTGTGVTPLFLEAARILGCDQANALLLQTAKGQ